MQVNFPSKTSEDADLSLEALEIQYGKYQINADCYSQVLRTKQESFMSSNSLMNRVKLLKLIDEHFSRTSIVDKLDRILNQKGKDCLLNRIFKLVKQYIGITLQNYLPWKEAFDEYGTGNIDNIKSIDLTSSVMWGIDPWDRPFILILYSYKKENVNLFTKCQTLTIFPRYVNNGENLVMSHPKKRLNFNLCNLPTLFFNLETLLEGYPIQQKRTKKNAIVTYEFLLTNFHKRDELISTDSEIFLGKHNE